jgi:threonine synthase
VSLKKGQEKRVKILVGTAGDTGPASAHSVANLERVDLVLLYPLNRVSKIQELQMLTVKAPNVHICAGNKRNINMINPDIPIFVFLSFFKVEGSSDDGDEPIKECFQDQHFSAANSLCSFNSIQWGRVLLQTAHYAYIYLQCCPNIGDEICIVVPTGAAGNLAGLDLEIFILFSTKDK